MPIFDSHCHYNLEPLWPDWEQHWQAAQTAGVTKSVVIGTSVETSQRALTIAAHPMAKGKLKAAIGIHPNEWDNPELQTEDIAVAVAQLDKLIDQHRENVVAVGETGLDYFHAKRGHYASEQSLSALKQRQQHALQLQLQLAHKHRLIPILHVRDVDQEAYQDVLRILKEENVAEPFILHCMSGFPAYIDEAVRRGAYVGIAGNITYKNAHALRELLTHVPSDRILLETDAPFLPPQTQRGKPCLPEYIVETAAFLHTERNCDLAAIFATTEKLLF